MNIEIIDRIFSDRGMATILAALRYWQREGLMSAGIEQDVASDCGRLDPLTVDEIEVLCEEINCSGHDPMPKATAPVYRASGHMLLRTDGRSEYLFDVQLAASIRLKAESEQAARTKLNELLDCVTVNIGEMDSEPVTAEASLSGVADLVEVNGDAV